MKKFIDFGIGIYKYKVKNILGNIAETTEEYYIYKYWFWGLFKRPLKFSIKNGWQIAYQVDVSYSEFGYTAFDNEYQCKQLIQDIKENPNKYILVY